MKKAVMQPFGIKTVLRCFKTSTEYRYGYVGITWNLFRKGTTNYKLLDNFIREFGEYIKPWWCPYWFLNLLHLYGCDNSIVRVRNWWIYELKNKIVHHKMISDIKTKYGTLRIYGSWDKYIEDKHKELCKLIDPTLEPY